MANFFLTVFLATATFVINIVKAQEAQTAQTYTYISRPDINPVALLITSKPSSDYECGYYFTCPSGTSVSQPGAAVYRSDGDLIWAGAVDGIADCTDLRTQTLNGTEVLTMWEGETVLGWGIGRALIMNSTYDLIYNLTTTMPDGSDLHEHQIPSVNNRTDLLSYYYPLNTDLSSVGGKTDGWLLECGFQEVDIATGNVLFTWNASSHVLYNESYIPYRTQHNNSESNAWDFFHLNSVDKDTDGNYLVSSRHYHQIFKINGTNGNVIWTMGGMTSSWSLCSDCNFEWQHFARWHDSYTAISLFDDASDGVEKDELTARGMILDLDFANMSTTLRTDFYPLQRMTVSSQGNTDLLPSGDWLVGWGANPWISEYKPDGTMIYSAALGGQHLTNGPVENYRAFKSTTWQGFPKAVPDVVVNGTTVYVSWNGATEVQTWEVMTGNGGTTQSLTSAANASRSTFETAITIPEAAPYVQVRAYASNGVALGASAVMSTANGSSTEAGWVRVPSNPESLSSPIVCGAYNLDLYQL